MKNLENPTMEEPSDTIFEEREELMISPMGGHPILRKAHFLNPFTAKPVSELPSSTKPKTELGNLSLKIEFRGWRTAKNEWKKWVQNLHSKYQSIWKQVGIYEAIMGSTYQIKRHKELVIGLAEKWCPETNTFIFPWGEATITLEDMLISGGYSVLGCSAFDPIRSEDLIKIQENLKKARRPGCTSGSSIATQYTWLKHFMGSGGEFEHEAFLSEWLSKFVFPKSSYNYIRNHVFPIAIRLARGIQVALAPAVLSNIYRDLGLLKERLFALETHDKLLVLVAPFQLVQLWAWERFPSLRPRPNSISCGEPRLAQWHNLRKVKIPDVRLVIDSAGESFQWRPYTIALKNWLFPKFYGDKEQWILFDPLVDKGLESFARCLRVSELVGVGCIEQYLPNRVAMQFGLDQDLPGHVARCNDNSDIAWCNYNRPVRDAKLYIPSRFFESDVTTRYLEWWKQSMLNQKDAIKPFLRRCRSSRRLPRNSIDKNEPYHVFLLPGNPSKCQKVGVEDSEAKHTFLEIGSKSNNVDNRLDVSASTAGDENVGKMKLMIKQERKAVQCEGSMGGSDIAMANAIECEAGIKDKEGERKQVVPGWELEVRVSRLEEIVTKLKAERFHDSDKFEEKPTKVFPSDR